MGKNKNNRGWDYANEQWCSDDQGQDHTTTNGVEHGQNSNHAPVNSTTNLGPLSQVVDEALSQILAAKASFALVGGAFSKYSQDIKKIPEIEKKHADMVAQCKNKDRVIKEKQTAVNGLSRQLDQLENEVAVGLAKLKGDREILEKDKEALQQQSDIADRKYKDIEMELKSNYEKILARKEADLETEHDARQKELAEDKKTWEAKHSKTIMALETSNQEGKRRITDLEAKLEACKKQLRNEKERYEDLDAAKTKYREEKEKLATKLQNLEDEFCLGGQTDRFYEEKFHLISDAVHSISHEFFDVELSDKSPSELEKIRDQLVKVDGPHLMSIPVSNSEVSRALIVAHAQRVISAALQKYVWQPFSSDRTLPETDTAILIRQIYDQVIENTNTTHGNGRAANLWKAQTTRALSSLCASPSSQAKADSSTKLQPIPTTSCAEKVIVYIFSRFSLLLESSQESTLRDKLSSLVKSAGASWMLAEADELILTVHEKLKYEDIQEWRSHVFDPPSSPPVNDKSGEKDIVSAPLPRIYTLFPRIIAKRTSKPVKTGTVMPGSWSDTEQQAPSVKLECIHAGVGLTESSELVVSGKMEVEETSRMLKESAEKVYKRLDPKKSTNGGTSRRGSSVSSITSPVPPSVLWLGRNRA